MRNPPEQGVGFINRKEGEQDFDYQKALLIMQPFVVKFVVA